MGEAVAQTNVFNFDVQRIIKKVRLEIPENVTLALPLFHNPTDRREFEILKSALEKTGLIASEAANSVKNVNIETLEKFLDDDKEINEESVGELANEMTVVMDGITKLSRALSVEIDAWDTILDALDKMFFAGENGKIPANISEFLTGGVLDDVAIERIEMFLEIAIAPYAKANNERVDKYKIKRGNRQARRIKKLTC